MKKKFLQAPAWLSIVLCLLLTACFSKEPEQRKAYMEFLQTHLVDNSDKSSLTILTPRQQEAFGPYGESFLIIKTFFLGMNERTGVGRNAAGKPKLPDLAQLVDDPGSIEAFTQYYTKRFDETGVLVQAADAAKAKLQLPDDLKAVFDKAYDRYVSKRGRDWESLRPLWEAMNDQTRKVATFVREHRSKIQISGNGMLTNDQAILTQMQELLKDLHAKQNAFLKAANAL